MAGATPQRPCSAVRPLVEFCKWQTRCGRFRWTVASFVVLAGLVGVATGVLPLIVLAAVPCVIATFWLVVSWEWEIVMEPWAAGTAQLRKPLLALNVLHWLGPAALPFLEPGGDGHGEMHSLLSRSLPAMVDRRLSLWSAGSQVLILQTRRRQGASQSG